MDYRVYTDVEWDGGEEKMGVSWVGVGRWRFFGNRFLRE
jgi:hypothetical protein